MDHTNIVLNEASILTYFSICKYFKVFSWTFLQRQTGGDKKVWIISTKITTEKYIKVSLNTICDCLSSLCCPLQQTPPVWHSTEVKTIYFQTLFVPALTLSQWHSLAYEGNAEGSPILFPVLCRLPTEWICPIPGISQGMWLECYLLPSGMPGSWFCLGFHEWPGISHSECFLP